MRKLIATTLLSLTFASQANTDVSEPSSFEQCLMDLKPFVIHYDLSAGFIDVTSEHKLQLRNGIWNYRSYADGGILGKAIEESDFILDGHFKLQQYNSYRRVAFNKKKRYVAMNWGDLSFSTSNNATGNFQYNEHIFDKASQQLAIQCKIRNGEENFTLKLATRSGLDTYDYKVVSYNDNIKTDMGDFSAIKVEQIRKDNRQVYFWLAPELDYFPIKFIYQEKGDDSIVASIKNFRYL